MCNDHRNRELEKGRMSCIHRYHHASYVPNPNAIIIVIRLIPEEGSKHEVHFRFEPIEHKKSILAMTFYE